MNERIKLIEHTNARALDAYMTATTAAGPISSVDHSALKEIERLVGSYNRQLRSLGNASGYQKVATARKRIIRDFGSNIAATLRMRHRVGFSITPTHLLDRAKSLDLGVAYYETVNISAQISKPGSWRPIAKSGFRRKAQQLILSDLLSAVRWESDCDSTVAGAGGEKAAFKKIMKAIVDGYTYWVSLDIRDFFPSLKPGHLAGIPLSNWTVANLIFLPSEAPIVFTDKKTGLSLGEQAILHGSDDDTPMGSPVSMGELKAMLKKVRQGLLQGDVCAPQIARTFLGRELQQTLKHWDVTCGTHLDDVVICARSRSELTTS